MTIPAASNKKHALRLKIRRHLRELPPDSARVCEATCRWLAARVVVLGHTHYPGVWNAPGAPGLTVINTGSFSRPFGGLFVELAGGRLQVRRIVETRGEFRPGRLVAERDLEN